jgi:two-component system, NarL family, response regulator LiaR
MGPNQIRVMLVDDHAMVRSGLRLFLMAFNDFSLVGEAADGVEAVRMCAQLHPDVILMDLIMPGMDGIHATRGIRSACPDTRVIALTSFTDPDLIVDAFQAGVLSFLLKTISAMDLAEAIRRAYRGEPTLAPEAKDALDKAANARADSQNSPVELSAREQQVLALMVAGKSNAEISRQLVVSLSTIKFHVSNVLRKLSASSRAEAIARAIQLRLVDPRQDPVEPVRNR